jgi:hypothetical protein
VSEAFNSKSAGRNLLVFCLCIELLILLLDLLINFFQLIDSRSIQHMFNVAREQSVGTWFSVVQAAFTGMVLLAIYFLKMDEKRVLGWLILGCFFIYMSVDDAAKIHERLGSYVAKKSSEADASLLGGLGDIFPSYDWQWVFAPFFIGMGCYILLFLWKQLNSFRLMIYVLAAFSCWAVAVGIDFIEGIDGLFEGWADNLGVKKYTVSHPFLMVEEFLEMFGTTLFLCVFVRVLVDRVNHRLMASPGR